MPVFKVVYSSSKTVFECGTTCTAHRALFSCGYKIFTVNTSKSIATCTANRCLVILTCKNCFSCLFNVCKKIHILCLTLTNAVCKHSKQFVHSCGTQIVWKTWQHGNLLCQLCLSVEYLPWIISVNLSPKHLLRRASFQCHCSSCGTRTDINKTMQDSYIVNSWKSSNKPRFGCAEAAGRNSGIFQCTVPDAFSLSMFLALVSLLRDHFQMYGGNRLGSCRTSTPANI